MVMVMLMVGLMINVMVTVTLMVIMMGHNDNEIDLQMNTFRYPKSQPIRGL